MDSKHLKEDEDEEEEDRKPAAKTTDETTKPSFIEKDIPVKPALILQNNKKKKSTTKHLKWDEQAIEEHDLLRGTRMKIDEPNTPYTYYSDSGAESDDSRKHCKSPAQQKPSLSWNTLETRLHSVANVREQYMSSPTSSFGGAETDQSDVEEERKKEMQRLEFRDHRKRHYDEYQMIKKFRQEHPDELNVDDEDEEDDDNNDADVEDESWSSVNHNA